MSSKETSYYVKENFRLQRRQILDKADTEFRQYLKDKERENQKIREAWNLLSDASRCPESEFEKALLTDF